MTLRNVKHVKRAVVDDRFVVEAVVAHMLGIPNGDNMLTSNTGVGSVPDVVEHFTLQLGDAFPAGSLEALFRVGGIRAVLQQLDALAAERDSSIVREAVLLETGVGLFFGYRFARIRGEGVSALGGRWLAERLYRPGFWYEVPRAKLLGLLREPVTESRGNIGFQPFFQFAVDLPPHTPVVSDADAARGVHGGLEERW